MQIQMSSIHFQTCISPVNAVLGLRFLLFLFLGGFGLLHHGVCVALAMVFEHLDEDVGRLEEIAEKGLGETRLVKLLQQHDEQIPILHHVEQIVLQNRAEG